MNSEEELKKEKGFKMLLGTDMTTRLGQASNLFEIHEKPNIPNKKCR